MTTNNPTSPREELARIIDPEAWGTYDHVASLPNDVMDAVMKYVEPSLAQADEWLSRPPVKAASPEGRVSVPIDAGQQLGENFLRALFDPKFDTPYADRLNALLTTASAARPPASERAEVVADTKAEIEMLRVALAAAVHRVTVALDAEDARREMRAAPTQQAEMVASPGLKDTER